MSDKEWSPEKRLTVINELLTTSDIESCICSYESLLKRVLWIASMPGWYIESKKGEIFKNEFSCPELDL